MVAEVIITFRSGRRAAEALQIAEQEVITLRSCASSIMMVSYCINTRPADFRQQDTVSHQFDHGVATDMIKRKTNFIADAAAPFATLLGNAKAATAPPGDAVAEYVHSKSLIPRPSSIQISVTAVYRTGFPPRSPPDDRGSSSRMSCFSG